MKFKRILPLVLAVMLVSSCKVPRDVTYFQDLKNGQVDEIVNNNGIRLKSDDKISIIVKSRNAEITNSLNLPVTNQVLGYAESSVINTSRGVSGYTIDRNGEIDFPMIGKLRIAGLTREEVAERVKKEIEDRELAKDVVVTVEFLNLHFSVSGEVNRPGQYNFGRDMVSITEALSLAGVMTLFGRRDSVFVIRESEGTRTTYFVNMLSGRELVNSPAYYLQQNDQVYVQPNDYRKRQSRVNGNVFQQPSFWMSLASVLTTVAVFFFK